MGYILVYFHQGCGHISRSTSIPGAVVGPEQVIIDVTNKGNSTGSSWLQDVSIQFNAQQSDAQNSIAIMKDKDRPKE